MIMKFNMNDLALALAAGANAAAVHRQKVDRRRGDHARAQEQHPLRFVAGDTDCGEARLRSSDARGWATARG